MSSAGESERTEARPNGLAFTSSDLDDAYFKFQEVKGPHPRPGRRPKTAYTASPTP